MQVTSGDQWRNCFIAWFVWRLKIAYQTHVVCWCLGGDFALVFLALRKALSASARLGWHQTFITLELHMVPQDWQSTTASNQQTPFFTLSCGVVKVDLKA
jgi:hypothetical protein